jgi:hypothetical protein
MLFILVIGILLLAEFALFNYPKVYGEEQVQPAISICQEKLNETKCNQINLYVLRPSRVVLVIVAVTAVSHEDDPICPIDNDSE